VFPGDILDVQKWTSYVKAFESYCLTDEQTDRHDRNYIPCRFVGGRRYVTRVWLCRMHWSCCIATWWCKLSSWRLDHRSISGTCPSFVAVEFLQSDGTLFCKQHRSFVTTDSEVCRLRIVISRALPVHNSPWWCHGEVPLLIVCCPNVHKLFCHISSRFVCRVLEFMVETWNILLYDSRDFNYRNSKYVIWGRLRGCYSQVKQHLSPDCPVV